ncbi:MAG: hypothetical protein GX595_15515 [Lentisphaerae bacterium]|nr:hypothetical protein [Lentisphaerota bacterium]
MALSLRTSLAWCAAALLALVLAVVALGRRPEGPVSAPGGVSAESPGASGEALRRPWRGLTGGRTGGPVEAARSAGGGAEVEALWATLLDVSQDGVVREAAALKLAGRNDPRLLDRLWDPWQQGLLPPGCSWIRDMMAAAEGAAAAALPVRPPIPAADLRQALAQAIQRTLPATERIAAARRLAAAQTDEAMAILEALWNGDFEAPAELRIAAFEAWFQAADQPAIAALGERLAHGNAPPADELLALLEAMAGEPHPGVREVALPLLQSPVAEVREEAAWLLTLNADEITAEEVPTLIEALGREPEAAVRRRLYSALGEAAAPYAEVLVEAIRTEESSAVRLSGFQAVASMAAADDQGAIDRLFDGQVAAELEQTALGAAEYQVRFEAVVVLKTARTPGAVAALQRLAASADDPRIAQAAALP